jgi:hypothetical protein
MRVAFGSVQAVDDGLQLRGEMAVHGFYCRSHTGE